MSGKINAKIEGLRVHCWKCGRVVAKIDKEGEVFLVGGLEIFNRVIFNCPCGRVNRWSSDRGPERETAKIAA